MLVPRRAIALLFALTLLVAVPAASADMLPTPGALLAKAKKGKGKKCGKGYVQKTVTKHGKKVKVCKKKGKKKAPPCRQSAGAGASCAIPGPQGLFEAPGKVLEGDAAKPFLQKYLANSTFTDCPRGWGVGGCTVEQRYSHAADATFHYCRLTSTSGADIRVTDEYGVEGAKIEADGSWTFREVVYNSGNYSHYEWNVSTTGVVNGAYQFTPSSQIEKIGPLQYLGGIAKDCSY